MDGSLQISPMTRLLALNTEIHEMRSQLMRQTPAGGRIAELQDGIDRRRRASLAACWLSGGYDLEDEGSDDGDGCAG